MSNDFGDWLEENEVKNTDTLVSKDAVDGGAIARKDGHRWVPAQWDTENPGNHKCHACAGRGLWSPPVYATRGKTGKCHKCQGRGHFKTSHAERTKNREYRRLTTAEKLISSKKQFEADRPG